MTICKHELRQGWVSLLIWAAAIGGMLGLCILIFPDMASDMGDIGAMFSDMGSFSAAFGMDRINFGEFIGFYGVECGNVLGLGGAFFAALTGITALAKEEKEHTAEFLLTHPVSRARVVFEKLIAVLLQVTILNLAAAAVTWGCIAIIGEEVSAKTMTQLLAGYYIMQLETAAITFGISAFMRRGSVGAGLGLAAVFYFLNIAANLTEKAQALKYITPFGYTDSADIIANGVLNREYLMVGVVIGLAGIAAAFWRYTKKDIA
ncbi:MAG: ABC transporter permease subunit [Oscillospiraceae bacterium]